MKVRMMNDTKTGMYFYERYYKEGNQWLVINSTMMACEGNCTHQLNQYIQKIKDEEQARYIKQVGEEIEIDM